MCSTTQALHRAARLAEHLVQQQRGDAAVHEARVSADAPSERPDAVDAPRGRLQVHAPAVRGGLLALVKPGYDGILAVRLHL